MDKIAEDILQYHVFPFLGLRDGSHLEESLPRSSTMHNEEFKNLWPIVEGKSQHFAYDGTRPISKETVWKMVHDRKEHPDKLEGPGHPLVHFMMYTPGFFESVPKSDRVEFARWIFRDSDIQWNPVATLNSDGLVVLHSEMADGHMLPEWIAEESHNDPTSFYWLHRKLVFSTKGSVGVFPEWGRRHVNCELMVLAAVEAALVMLPVFEPSLYESLRLHRTHIPPNQTPYFASIPLLFCNPAQQEDIQGRWAGLVHLMSRSHQFDLLHWKAKARILDELVRRDVLLVCTLEVLSWVKTWLDSWPSEAFDGRPGLEQAHSRARAQVSKVNKVES